MMNFKKHSSIISKRNRFKRRRKISSIIALYMATTVACFKTHMLALNIWASLTKIKARDYTQISMKKDRPDSII